MHGGEASVVQDAARGLAADPASERDRSIMVAAGVGGISALEPLLRQDRPIAELEELESVLKAILLDVMTGAMTGARARDIAIATRNLGLIYKYKSYAAKCSSPLGYSVFLQNERQGFSFQRHVTRKIEIFHIVEVTPGAMVFLAPHDEWERLFEPERFASWLSGSREDPALDRFRIDPQPGDVYVIDELNVVHTVLGCVLEEFATISTDHVDRLFDQNQGRVIPPEFTRPSIYARLRRVGYPGASRFVGEGGVRQPDIRPRRARGESVLSFHDGRLFAQRRFVDADADTDLDIDTERARSLHVTGGQGTVVISDTGRPDPGGPGLDIAAGDTLLVPQGVFVGFRGGPAGVQVSEQRVSAADALSP